MRLPHPSSYFGTPSSAGNDCIRYVTVLELSYQICDSAGTVCIRYVIVLELSYQISDSAGIVLSDM